MPFENVGKSLVVLHIQHAIAPESRAKSQSTSNTFAPRSCWRCQGTRRWWSSCLPRPGKRVTKSTVRGMTRLESPEGEQCARQQPLESPAELDSETRADVVARGLTPAAGSGTDRDHADDRATPTWRSTSSTLPSFWRRRSATTSSRHGERGRADEGERSHPRMLGWEGSSGICAGETMPGIGPAGCPAAGDRLVIALEQILIEVLVRVETLRHLPDRRIGLVQVDHLPAQGLEVSCAAAPHGSGRFPSRCAGAPGCC